MTLTGLASQREGHVTASSSLLDGGRLYREWRYVSVWARRAAPIRAVIVNDHLGYANGVIHGPARWFENVLPLFDPAKNRAELLILGKLAPFAAELRGAGISVRFFNRSKWDPRVLADLVRFLLAYRADVLHIMGMKGMMISPIAARAVGGKVIVNFRDTKPVSPALRPLVGAAVRHADLALSCSNGVAEFAARHFALSPAKSRVLRNAIPGAVRVEARGRTPSRSGPVRTGLRSEADRDDRPLGSEQRA